MVQNPDGTWSLWGEGGDKPIRTYTDQAKLRMLKEDEALRLEVGSNGQSIYDVEGLTKGQGKQVEELANKLRTGEPYANVAEAELGESVVAEAEASGTLPAFADVAGAVGAGAGGIAWGLGVAYVGVQIGNGIDSILGLPQLSIDTLFSSESENKLCDGEHGPFCEYFIETQLWKRQARIIERAKSCKALYEEYGYPVGHTSASQKCVPVQGYIQRKQEEEHNGGTVTITHAGEGWLGHFGEEPARIAKPCYPSGQLKGGFCPQEGYDEDEHGHYLGKTYWNMWDLSEAKGKPEECKTGGGICYPKSSISEPAFPAAGLEPAEQPPDTAPEGAPGLVTVPAPLTTPVKPSAPTEVNPKVITYIIYEHPEEFPEAPPENEEEEKEKEKPIPSPLWPTLPKPEPNEVGTDYKNKIESDGFTDVEIQVLPASRVDPRVGPSEVSKVDPKPDNPYDPATKVTVVVNPGPDDGAVPGGETGKIPPINIGGVDEPELKPPHLNVLCENFPFGVPCWLIEQFNSWSTTGSAPNLCTSSYTVKGHKIDAACVNLDSLETVMSKVRPVMIIFGTIGLVLLFYGFATGGNPGSGSGSSAGGEPSSEEGED